MTRPRPNWWWTQVRIDGFNLAAAIQAAIEEAQAKGGGE